MHNLEWRQVKAGGLIREKGGRPEYKAFFLGKNMFKLRGGTFLGVGGTFGASKKVQGPEKGRRTMPQGCDDEN